MNEAIKQQLENTPIGTYLMIWGRYGNAINPTIEQGQLKSVDSKNGTVVLHSMVYDRDQTVRMDQMSSIDDSRSGPGARGPAQTPDWRQDVQGNWSRDLGNGHIQKPS